MADGSPGTAPRVPGPGDLSPHHGERHRAGDGSVGHRADSLPASRRVDRGAAVRLTRVTRPCRTQLVAWALALPAVLGLCHTVILEAVRLIRPASPLFTARA